MAEKISGAAIGKALDLGFRGTISRQVWYIVTNRTIKEGSPGIAFGDPVILNPDNTVQAITAGTTLTADNFAGISCREVKQMTFYRSNEVQYLEYERCDVISLGSVTVLCGRGTPVAGGQVYIRIAENANYPNSPIGGYETEADGANTVLIPGMAWKSGYIDSNRIAEVTMLNRVSV